MPLVGTDQYDATLDSMGLLLVPNTLRRFDTVPFSPQVRSTDPRFSDFSNIQYWVLRSWHRGRGALEWEDPSAFYDSQNVDTRIPNSVTLSPLQLLTTKAAAASIAGNPVVFKLITSSANLMVATGGVDRDVFQWNNATSVWAPETSGITADPTDMAEFNGIILVACGNGTLMRLKTSGTWANAAAGVDADFLCPFNNFVLYRATNQNEIYWTTDGTTWSGPIYVGDTNTQVRGMAVGDGRLYVGKDDGLYYIQNNQAYQLLDFQWARDPNNFSRMKWWNNALYFPILNGLFRLVGNTLQSVGPNKGAGGLVELGQVGADVELRSLVSLASGQFGRIVDLVPGENFFYAVVDAGQNSDAGTSQILAYNGVGWHQVVQGAAANNRIRAAFFTGRLASTGQFNNPRLWFGYANDVYNIILPYGTDNPYDYASQTYFAGTGITAILTSPWFDAGLASVYKQFFSVALYTEGLTAAETLQVAYELDGVGAYQNLVTTTGAAYAFTSSPHQEIVFPDNTIAKRIRIRIAFVRGGTTTLTPRLRIAVVGFAPRPNTKYGWQGVLRTGRNMAFTDSNGRRRVTQADPDEWVLRMLRYRDYRQRVAWDDGSLEPDITNLVLNPSFFIDSDSDGLANNWNLVSTPTATLSIIRKIHGIRSQQIVTAATGTQGVETDTITTVNGTRYTASCYLYLASGDTVTLEMREQGGGTVLASVTRTTTTSRFVRLEVTVAATSTTTRVRIVRNTADAAAATTFNVSAVQLEVTTDARFALFEQRASSFCDGEQANCVWTGRAHLSTSTRAGTVPVFVTNVQRTETQRPSIMERIRGRGNETRLVFTVLQVG